MTPAQQLQSHPRFALVEGMAFVCGPMRRVVVEGGAAVDWEYAEFEPGYGAELHIWDPRQPRLNSEDVWILDLESDAFHGWAARQLRAFGVRVSECQGWHLIRGVNPPHAIEASSEGEALAAALLLVWGAP